MEYNFSAVKLCSNTCVGPIANTNMSFCYYQYEQKNSYIFQTLIHFDANGKPPLLLNPIP